MIARVWHGSTSDQNAGAYLAYLQETGVKDCLATPGSCGVFVFWRLGSDRAEFLFISLWTSLDEIRRFARGNLEAAVYYPQDSAFLLELEPTVEHYEAFAFGPSNGADVLRPPMFGGFTVEFRVPDFQAGLAFYSRLFGRRPDFRPHDDFVEWEVSDNCWFQVGEGEPRPTHPLRFRVRDIDAERRRLERELGVLCSPVTRIPGLVAFCNFSDAWGNELGFYQRLFIDGVPRVPGGSYHDWEASQS